MGNQPANSETKYNIKWKITHARVLQLHFFCIAKSLLIFILLKNETVVSISDLAKHPLLYYVFHLNIQVEVPPHEAPTLMCFFHPSFIVLLSFLLYDEKEELQILNNSRTWGYASSQVRARRSHRTHHARLSRGRAASLIDAPKHLPR
jgi:hypothetical protein